MVATLVLGAGYLAADRLSGASAAGPGHSDPYVLETTIRKLVTEDTVKLLTTVALTGSANAPAPAGGGCCGGGCCG